MRRAIAAVLLCSLSACGDSTKPNDDAPPMAEEGEELSGGETTVFDISPLAFSLAARNLDASRRDDFAIGNSAFNDNWVIAPASTTARDGLGPLFSARSCSGCHVFDGRDHAPTPGGGLGTMVLRLSVPGTDPHGGPLPDPVYGGALSPFAIPGVVAEGDASITYVEHPGSFPDGEAYSLREPVLTLVSPGYGPFAGNLLRSPRLAPVVIGLGLLEAIPDATIQALADPNDANGDGISGRVNMVWDDEAQTVKMGRIGWKANVPSLRLQTAGAFNGDIGITSSIFPTHGSTPAQAGLDTVPNGGSPELDPARLDAVVTYLRTLAVPARRDVDDPTVLAGKQAFADAGCARCHIPKLQTGASDLPELAFQTIRPFTDLLLHDMGPGLADGRPDFQATGSEWRTPPLWGIGLVSTVNRHTDFLHDGRARNFVEAILWHGGEAQAARDRFAGLAASERAALLAYLQSL
ncbi:MAG: di-heme oxidoredictase family protein [Gemmatimonadales bacterium]